MLLYVTNLTECVRSITKKQKVLQMKSISEEVFKSGSIAGQIYFLLLGIPRTVSEISKYLYNGKVQLTHINRIIDKLEREGHIEEVSLTREVRRNKKLDLRAKFWKAKTDLLVDYCERRINSRLDKKKISDTTEDLNKLEKTALKKIFDSKWFSKFFENDYLRHDIDINIREGDYLRPSNPFQFLGFTIEDIGAVSFFVNRKTGLHILIDDLLKTKNFDEFIHKNINIITPYIRKKIIATISQSKNYLGNYEDTNSKLDYMIQDFGIFFIPNNLAYKLTRVGRIPLTLSLSLQQ